MKYSFAKMAVALRYAVVAAAAAFFGVSVFLWGGGGRTASGGGGGGGEVDRVGISENEISAVWCEKHGGESQKRMPNGTWADCVTAEFAVEFDFGRGMKPYECAGQAFRYADLSGKRPLCVLIMAADISARQFLRAIDKIASPVQVACVDETGKEFVCPKK